jgi:hypothetical protein
MFKKSSKRNQNPSSYYNPITLESKNSIKIDGQNHHMEDEREGQEVFTHSPREPKNPRTNLMPSFNTSQNINFQKSSYKNRPIT